MTTKSKREINTRLKALENKAKPQEKKPLRIVWVDVEKGEKRASTDTTEVLIIWPNEKGLDDDEQIGA